MQVESNTNKVVYLCFDLDNGSFSLESCIHEQTKKLPKVNSRGEIGRILSIFNVCCNVRPGLSKIVEPLQATLNAKKLPECNNLCRWTEEIWTFLFKNNMKLV